MKTIGIIGAGACGLNTIRHSVANGISPIAWEHGPTMGGTWNYTDSVGKDEYGYPLCASMYKNLKTNIPKEIMGFPDFPFPDEAESYVHHSSVLKYLQLYAKNYDLTQYINYNHHVNLVEPIFDGTGPPSWSVTVENLKTGEICKNVCDFLMVCNGHYAIPRESTVLDIEKFNGIQLHSHSYRKPDMFGGKTVAVLGAGPSGIDVALELCDVANKVYLCHNLPIPIPSKLPSNLYQRKGIVEAHVDGFTLKDKSFIEVDALLYCTGYDYEFQFLSAACKVSVENNTVRPLYKHVLHADFPSMGFPGLIYQILPFPTFDVQIRYLISVFSEKTTVPSSVEMNLETDRALLRFTYTGNDSKKFSHFFVRQEEYRNHLLDEMQQKRLPKYYNKTMHVTILRAIFSLSSFKQYKYAIRPDATVMETLNGEEVATSFNLPVNMLYRMAILSVTNYSDLFHLICSMLWKKIKVSISDCLSWLGLWDNYL